MAFNTINGPKDSDSQILGDIYVKFNGTVRSTSCIRVPNDADDPFAIHPDVVKKNEERTQPTSAPEHGKIAEDYSSHCDARGCSCLPNQITP